MSLRQYPLLTVYLYNIIGSQFLNIDSVDSGKPSLSGLEKITGINQKQLWSYLNGTKQRKAQRERIENGLRRFSREMSSIFA